MKVLVTGATGLIGGQVVKALLKQGSRVKALVRKESNTQNLASLPVEFCYGDILNADSLKKAAKGCEIIYHTAGSFAYWGYNGREFIDNAQKGMENIILAAAKNKIKKIVFTSSSVTIGAAGTPQELSEDDPGSTADAPVYVQAKIAQEKTAFEKGHQYNVNAIAVCPTLTIGGPDTHLTESNRMIVNYLKDPFKSTWIGGCNLVHAKDVAAAMLLLGRYGKAGQRYIAGSDNLEWRQVHALISELCGMPGPYLQAYHTSSYLLSAMEELWCYFTNERPASTREQAKMVGKYYWYKSDKLTQTGYRPQSSEKALIETISWLVTSNHIPASLRAAIQLSDKVYAFRNKYPVI